jgi:hypothetical protein
LIINHARFYKNDISNILLCDCFFNSFYNSKKRRRQ